MSAFPLAVRVAAGIAASVLEEAQKVPAALEQLPDYLLSVPVSVMSQVAQNVMHVQQQVTALAIKGDEALALLSRPEEQPAWATFDPVPASTAPGKPGTTPGAPGAAPAAAGRFALYSVDPVTSEPSAEAKAAASETSIPAPEAPIEGYDAWSVAQLRPRLRKFTVAQLEQLQAYEAATLARPPFLTMLGNRLTTVGSR